MLTKAYDKALKRYEQNPSEENERWFWKCRDRLVNQFIHKYEFDVARRVEKDILDANGNPVLDENGVTIKEELYAFDNAKRDVLCFNIALIYHDIKYNIPKGKVFDYSDYYLDNLDNKEYKLLEYKEWLKYN